MAEILGWLVRRLRPHRGWAAFLLALTALVCLPSAAILIGQKLPAARSLAALTPINGALLALTILGMIAGLAMARLSLQGLIAGALGGLAGAALAGAIVGRLIPPLALLWAEFGSVVELLGQRQTVVGRPLPLALLAGSFWQRLAGLGNRIWWDVESLVIGGSLWDTTLYLLLATFLAWAIAAFAAWHIYRRSAALAGLLPNGILLSLVTFYYRDAAPYLIGYLFCTLWLLALGQLWTRWEHWDRSNTDYPDSLGTELALSLTPWIFALIALAAVFPNKGFWKVSHAFWDTVEGVTGPFESTDPKIAGTGDQLPRSHLLGSGADLEEIIVLYVTSGDPPPPQTEPEVLESPTLATVARYWRGTTYDTYTGQGWINGPLESRITSPGQPLDLSAQPVTELRQEFELVAVNGDYLYAANAPLRVDHAVETRWRSPDDLADLIRNADRYTVISAPPEASVSDLRARPAAATSLPPDLIGRYLALPDSLPQRVRDLAGQATAGAQTDYDAALAIETYLRAYTYTLDLPLPPGDRDLVDYFLFDLQEGYCDYYASAMVVLARSAGIPARFATGYAQGQYDYDTGRWVVTEKEGHSWVEVYFDGIGWVEFEPTAARPLLARSGGTEVQRPAVPPLPPRPAPWWHRVPWGLAALAALLALSAAVVVWIWLPGQRRDVEAASLIRDRHERLIRWGARLGQPLRDGQTPYEYGATLAETLRVRGKTSRWAAVRDASAQASSHVERLAGTFVRAQYSPQPIADREGWQIRELWPRLRRHLFLLWFSRRLSRR